MVYYNPYKTLGRIEKISPAKAANESSREKGLRGSNRGKVLEVGVPRVSSHDFWGSPYLFEGFF